MVKRDDVPGLGALLKATREKSGMTQAAVETASGVARTNLSLFESGAKTPTLSTLYKLADAYGVNVCDLLPGGVLPAEVAEPTPAAAPPAKPATKKKGKK